MQADTLLAAREPERKEKAMKSKKRDSVWGPWAFDSSMLKFIYKFTRNALMGHPVMTAEERVRILRDARPNSWVAFSSDESKLVGRGDSYEEAVEDAQNHGESDPILVKIPDNWEPRAFRHCA